MNKKHTFIGAKALENNNERSPNNNLDKIINELEKTKSLCSELDAVIECSYDGIYITDGQANTLKINKSYEKITGLTREYMIGKNMKDLVKEGVISQSGTLLVIKSKKPTTIEQTFKTGKKVLVSSSPIFHENGNIRMVVTNVRDVTQLYELKEQLAKNEELTKKYYSEIEAMRNQLLNSSDIIAQDKNMLDTLRIGKKVANVDTTVLLLGETGVGKEEVAKYIHKNSKRCNKHFIKVNCGAIPENLIESELFGYEKGAFTGANKEGKIGLFEVADEGTIFLDEVGELPLDMQVKLLRVLQEKEIERVGGVKPIKIDVRILAATNRNLEEMVSKKLFREDLYYRLNVVPIEIPPLRERKKDIVPLVEHFLSELNKKYNLSKRFTSVAMQSLLQYNWPGNVRELKNIVERVVIMSSNDVILKSDLPINNTFNLLEEEIGSIDEEVNLKEIVERFELKFINKAFENYKNVRDAAKYLGMDPSTFVRKRKKYTDKYMLQK
ncbi:PAS domain S-box-containing protein [Clostridium tetanomorphum]|uniref:HTH-type transcriptional regulatory protein TyrR n=1 Tax=Clostridium tetanomorphum TaxID=1553 RepID=A0A923IZI2_CLOTT|nr:sigma 54-interacting transcriptional regulator [Clostridium tetanomorphum]KAJ52007.1 sigma-54 dependent transcription regulator [Clostridium tetanomorphum DSM 665]MBC2397017.1 sigma 54-interacting transcriptional regulator [Clostridium tetanomorphum]MBP1862927.1 PAS domain S-box-containing protein [Clostridium tetanomorphum]NRS87064.1 PAS domain S-box-containing protein [Clostridium tetanomorphum]NRZ99141.1 PAS domain S-box-containing protein [Clostridium tetanomorphum]